MNIHQKFDRCLEKYIIIAGHEDNTYLTDKQTMACPTFPYLPQQIFRRKFTFGKM